MDVTAVGNFSSPDRGRLVLDAVAAMIFDARRSDR
jgi:hypothetical protein